MVSRDRLYAETLSERHGGPAGTVVDLGGGREFPVEPRPVIVDGSIDVDAAIAGDLRDLHAEVSAIADRQLELTMRAYFEMMIDVTQRAGNAVDAHGDVAEGFLAMIEKMDMEFGEDGLPALRLVVSPADEARVRAQLGALMPDQQRRLGDIIERKREAYRASRRRRRFPRLGH
jgi:hypothetical protein